MTSFAQGGKSPEFTWTYTSLLTRPTNGQIQVSITSAGVLWDINSAAFPTCDFYTGAPASNNPLSECGLTLLIDGSPVGSTSHVWYTQGQRLFQIFPETATGGYYPITPSTTYSLTFAESLWNVSPYAGTANMRWDFYTNPDRTISRCCTPAATVNPTYSVTFDANGGIGSMADQTDSSLSPLSANLFTRDGYTFSGWATSDSDAEAGIVTYTNEEDFPFDSDATLFAVWTSNDNGNGISASLPATGATLLTSTVVGVGGLALGGAFLVFMRRRRVTVSSR